MAISARFHAIRRAAGGGARLGLALAVALATLGVSAPLAPAAAAGPAMTVSGNSVAIANGDLTPSVADFTDFGGDNQGVGERVFTIQNTGDADLTLTGAPKVAIGGANAAHFIVVADPASPVAPGGGRGLHRQAQPGQ